VDGLLKALLAAGPAVRACKKLVLDVAEREINAQLIAATVEVIADIRASEEGKEACRPSSASASRPGYRERSLTS
jgi:methylglutaconyl-CoA hydratase